MDLDLVEKEISELCPCKRGFKLEEPGKSAIVIILAKPVHLVEMIRNPRSLLQLSRVTVRKQLNRRIDRVQELDIPQKLRDDVTRKHFIADAFIKATLDRCEPVGNACECGRIYGRL